VLLKDGVRNPPAVTRNWKSPSCCRSQQSNCEWQHRR